MRRTTNYRIDPFDLHLLTAVVEHGTITAAAGVVNLSLAATSERLKTLEAAVGTSLFERGKHGARPTAAGRALVRHAGRVLAELESLHHEMASFGGGLRGSLRVSCTTVALAEMLPSRLACFLLRYPDLDIEVDERSSEGVIDALQRGLTDLGIVSDYVDTSPFVTRPWIEDQLVAALPRAWRTGRRRSIGFAEVLDRPVVGLLPDSGLSRLLASQASRMGRYTRHRVRLNNFEAIGQVVAAGVGAAIIPGSFAHRLDAARVRCLPLSDAWAKRRMVLCTTAHSEAIAGIRLLVDALVDALPSASSAPRPGARSAGGLDG